MVRVLFCLFADDTSIFEPEQFTRYIRDRTAPDGSDTGSRLANLFEVLNTPHDARLANLDEDLAAFPYVNSDLFAERLRTAGFGSHQRTPLQCPLRPRRKLAQRLPLRIGKPHEHSIRR